MRNLFNLFETRVFFSLKNGIERNMCCDNPRSASSCYNGACISLRISTGLASFLPFIKLLSLVMLHSVLVVVIIGRTEERRSMSGLVLSQEEQVVKNLLIYRFLFFALSVFFSCCLALLLLGKLGFCFWKMHCAGLCELLMVSFKGQIVKVGKVELMAAECETI